MSSFALGLNQYDQFLLRRWCEDRHTGRRAREDRGRDWSDGTINQGTPRMNIPPHFRQKAEEAKKDSTQSWREHGSEDT